MEERKLSDSAHPSHDESMEEGGLSSTVKPSPPISLKELALTHGVEGKTFRAIGRVVALDLLDNRVTIGDGKDSDEATLHLDVSLVTPFPHVKGSVVQVIGEMHVVGKDRVMQVRVARNVDHLDRRLYDNAVNLQRMFLAKLK